VAQEAVYIGLGSNLGDRIGALRTAVENLMALENSKLTAVSGIYETSPVGLESGPFLNAVAGIVTGLLPHPLLFKLMDMEKDMGRERVVKMKGKTGSPQARVIDLDLLLYGNAKIRDKDLELPHPRMLHRRFVLEPLAELAPEIEIPPSGITVSEAAKRLAIEHPEQKIRRLGTLEEIRGSSRFQV
jgi:2-amino-4-hydroxy-6-hydroxymethyldihydropteridine diphosphokinase